MILSYTNGVNYKIVIHDNNSTDHTIGVIENIKSDKIEIIDSKANYGFGYGHNQVLKKYDASIIFFIIQT